MGLALVPNQFVRIPPFLDVTNRSVNFLLLTAAAGVPSALGLAIAIPKPANAALTAKENAIE